MMKSTIVGIIPGHRSCFWRLSPAIEQLLNRNWTVDPALMPGSLEGWGTYGFNRSQFQQLSPCVVRTAAPQWKKKYYFRPCKYCIVWEGDAFEHLRSSQHWLCISCSRSRHSRRHQHQPPRSTPPEDLTSISLPSPVTSVPSDGRKLLHLWIVRIELVA